MNASVIIPTLQAGPELAELLARLAGGRLRPLEVIVVDSSSTDGTAELARGAGCRVVSISRAEFNHGGTRNLAARLATGDVLVFMTQDALPADEHCLEALLEPIRTGEAAATFARQLPRADAPPAEAFARRFNYPPESKSKSLADLPRLGVKTYFFSNVCSAVSARAFWAVGGFPERTIMNEDMVLCAKLMRAGHTVRYAAEARVLHSHRYGAAEQFRRNFDVGVFMAHNAELLAGARVGGEGLRFVVGQLAHLARSGHWRGLPSALLENAAKLAGFSLGRQEARLPLWLKRRLSLHRRYWDGPRAQS